MDTNCSTAVPGAIKEVGGTAFAELVVVLVVRLTDDDAIIFLILDETV